MGPPPLHMRTVEEGSEQKKTENVIGETHTQHTRPQKRALQLMHTGIEGAGAAAVASTGTTGLAAGRAAGPGETDAARTHKTTHVGMHTQTHEPTH
jgi:hypothetical protein